MVRRISRTPASPAAGILLAITCVYATYTTTRCSAFAPIVDNQRVRPSPSAPPLSSHDDSSSATPPPQPPQSSAFASLDLLPDVLESVRGQDWQTPTPIQQLVIPEIIQMEETGCDSIWSEAPTGSGKTGAFALPLVQKLLRQKRAPPVCVGGPAGSLKRSV